MNEHTTLDFTMDPNLLVSVIKMQAGSLAKALLEGVMNSIDAHATRVELTVTRTGFTITDDGRGFSSEEEIKELFGRFGTPHVEGDATYGRFRMGRGQLMAYAATTWRSGRFEMVVDIEADGLTYKLREFEKPVEGCAIEGRLYQQLPEWKLRDTLYELKKLVEYAPKPVYVNGDLYGAEPSRMSSWTFEDEDAYYRVVQGADWLKVYNLGVFVDEVPAYRVGMGGVVVSKRALTVNFARNSVMEDHCSVWGRIRAKIEELVMAKLSKAKALNEAERKFLAARLTKLQSHPTVKWQDIKLLTDPAGKHLALKALKNFKRFVYIEDAQGLACSVHGTDGTFVVTSSLLERFGASTLSEFLTRMETLGVVNETYEVIYKHEIAHLGLNGAKILETDGLTRRERAAFATLALLNEMLANRLQLVHEGKTVRELRVGAHKTARIVAWTDGKTYITANRKYLSWFHRGIDGVHEWLLTLLHEYVHDTDDSESHSHAEVFYQTFHDVCFVKELELASLARIGLREYLKQLYERGVPRPRRLTKQLRE
jgi:hypothetical protein